MVLARTCWGNLSIPQASGFNQIDLTLRLVVGGLSGEGGGGWSVEGGGMLVNRLMGRILPHALDT